MTFPAIRTGRPASQRGAALVVAMLVFALATALVVAMQKEFTLFLKRGSNQMVGDQALAYLRGGEELAIQVLRQDWRDDQAANRARDAESDIWAQEATPYPLDEGGWLVGSLQDLQGRFNLNKLAGATGTPNDPKLAKRFTPNQKLFIRLLQTLPDVNVSLQEAVVITESVMDWLDKDTEQRNDGAEDGFYYDRSPSYRAANGEMSSVSELRAVANVTPEIFDALAPLVTVWGGAKPLNVNMAPVEVLRSINDENDLAPLSESEGETLLQERGEEGFGEIGDFYASTVMTGKNLGQLTGELGESTDVFLFVGEVEVADRVSRLYSVLQRDQDSGLVNALVRASGSL